MSSENILESSEELDNVPLVRMEDVQPIDRNSESYQDEEVLETCILDEAEYEECVLDDDDSNIGSMVSIKSEDVGGSDEGKEMIIPEVVEAEKRAEKHGQEQRTHLEVEPKLNRPDSWPTLEILPGGVINLADKHDPVKNLKVDTDNEPGDMMYACAKCSQSFKYLFCLVKHVKLHEDEAKKAKGSDLTKLSPLEKKMADLERRGKVMDKIYKKQNVQALRKRIAKQTKKKNNNEKAVIVLNASKRKPGPKSTKTKSKKVPKRS